MITSINEFKLILEIGEATITPYEYKLLKSSNNTYTRYTAYFSSTEYKYIVYLHIYNDDTFKELEIGFTVDNGDIETKENKQYAILSTIIAIIKEVITLEPDINKISFTAKRKENEQIFGKNQRLLFYLNYVTKHLNDNWEIKQNNNQISIYKIK